MEPQPKCYVCPADAVARLMVGSLGVQDALCQEHLQPRQRAYELSLTSFHIVSLVRTPERVEDAYKEIVQDLRESERATSETLNALDATNAKVSRLELDCERLARRVAEEKVKVLDRLESEARLTEELEAERGKVDQLSEHVAELERLLAHERAERGPEHKGTGEGEPAAGEPWAVVEGSAREGFPLCNQPLREGEGEGSLRCHLEANHIGPHYAGAVGRR